MHILYKKIFHIALLLTFVCLWGCGDSDESGEENDDAGQGTDSGNTEEDGGLDAGEGDDAGANHDAGPEYDPCWSVMDGALPEGIGLNGVWGSGLDDVFAAGGIREDSDGGIKTAIMHFNGTSWSRMDIPDIPGFIHFIQGNSSGRVCTLSSSGYLMIFDGTKWNVSTTGLSSSETRSDYIDFFYINDDDIYITRSMGFDIHLYHYDGKAWESPLDPGSLFGIWANNSNDVFIAEGSGLFHFNGVEWQEIQNPFEMGFSIDVWGTSSDNVYITAVVDTTNNALLCFNGSSWKIITEQIPLENKRLQITGSDSNDVYVHGVGYEVDGSVAIAQESIVYHYDGNKCSKMRIPQSWIILNIWAASEGEAFAVGYDSEDEKARIFRYSCGI